MTNIVGFSRGGTHLFWCFISAHSKLINPKFEINDLVGSKEIGFSRKIILEICSLLRIHSTLFNDISEETVQKAVCSWYPNLIFKLLKRHDPMKYFFSTSLNKNKTIFIVKEKEEQIRSWMGRGASYKVAEKAYEEHLKNWLNYSAKFDSLFVRYRDFCANPVLVSKCVWEWLGLPKEEFPKKVCIKPKDYKQRKIGMSAHSPERKWKYVTTESLAKSLKLDGSDNKIATSSNSNYLKIQFLNVGF